jgi:hypothetical protein
MRLLRTVLVSGSAVFAAGALALTSGSTATIVAAPGRAAHATSAGPSAKFLASARAALVDYLRHNHPQAMLVHPGSIRGGLAGTTKEDSFNWSGYADVSSTHQAFSRVSAKWTTPKVKCTAEDTLTSEWVGIDGATNTTVEQDGTFGWCYRGKPTYYTWYEMFPNSTQEIGRSLKPGDKITATVSRSGTSYKLSVTDATRKSASFSRTKTCVLSSCLDQSVEWIAERPEFSTTGIAPLADYGSWKVSSMAESNRSKISVSKFEIGMLDSTEKYLLSTPSSISHSGFTTKWHNSY